MHEKYVLKAKKAMKVVAAVGTGMAMLGATLTGAMALKLSEYPAPFVDTNGVYNSKNVFVVGDKADAADTLGLSLITANMQYLAKTKVTSGGTTVSVTGGKTNKIALGWNITSGVNKFDAELQDDDLEGFFDGEITFQGAAYDTSEKLNFTGGPLPQTSLTSSDDDYKSDIYFELPARKVINYYYVFDEAISLNASTTAQPAEIKFLGKTLKITNVASTGTTLTAYVGEEYYLTEGETVTVNGKEVKLLSVGSASVSVSVDGVTKVINTATTNTVNGLEITVDSVIAKSNAGESSANLVVGTQSAETYDSGDAFIGEDQDDPDWVWSIANIFAVSTGQILGVQNDNYFDDYSDSPKKVGECISMPNSFASVCLDSLSVPDDQYKALTIELETNTDLSDAWGSGGTNTSMSTIHISTPLDEGLTVHGANILGDQNVTSDVKTKEVWIAYTTMVQFGVDMNSTPAIFYKDKDSPHKIKYVGKMQNTTADAWWADFASFNYDQTKGTATSGNIQFDLKNFTATGLTLRLDIDGDTAGTDMMANDDLAINWTVTTVAVTSLGPAKDTEEASELVSGTTSIGTKDEDHRNAYGIKILNPKSHGASDEVSLMIPSDQVYANIVVKGPSAVVTSGGSSYVPTSISPVSKLASEVSSPASYNIVAIGGPCANALSASLFGVTCDGWELASGEAMVKLVENGDNVAMLVAGTSAADTRRACKAVAEYETYLMTVDKAEAKISGTSNSDISVS